MLMDTELLEGIKHMLAGGQKMDKELSESAKQVLDAFTKKRSGFLAKKEHVKDDIESGQRLTKHRISL